MPKKILAPEATPTYVLERLSTWGRCIRTQRKVQRITGANLCQRMGISVSTLQRIEMGDPGVGAAHYLTALMILGVMDFVAPTPDQSLWHAGPHVRARPFTSGSDDDF
jgi:hypothetical protein